VIEVRPGGLEGCFFGIGEGRECGEHGAVAVAVDEDGFKEVGWDGDLIEADGFGFGGFEESAGDDADVVGAALLRRKVSEELARSRAGTRWPRWKPVWV